MTDRTPRRRPLFRALALSLGAVCALILFAASHGASVDGPRPEPAVRAQIDRLLAEQSRAWSRGDLETFVSAYADDVLFLSPTGTTRGRQGVLERYRNRYPDAAAMGELTLEIVDVRYAYGEVGDDGHRRVAGVSVAGRWHLTYPNGAREDASGSTLIVLLPGPDGSWQIVQDASM